MARTAAAPVVADPAVAVIGHNNPPKAEKIFGMDPSKIDTRFLTAQAKKLTVIGSKLTDNAQLAAVTAKTRASWFEYGAILKGVRVVVTSKTGFNEWLKANDLEQYADRNTRTDAMWMAEKFDPEFLEAHVPADRHSPKRIREWYRGAVSSIIDTMGGETNDEAASKLSTDQRALYDQHSSEDWDALVAGWKAKQANAPLKWHETDPADAARVLLIKIAKHGNPGEVSRIVADTINGITADPASSWATWLASVAGDPVEEPEEPEEPVEEPEEEPVEEPEEGEEDEEPDEEEEDEEPAAG